MLMTIGMMPMTAVAEGNNAQITIGEFDGSNTADYYVNNGPVRVTLSETVVTNGGTITAEGDTKEAIMLALNSAIVEIANFDASAHQAQLVAGEFTAVLSVDGNELGYDGTFPPDCSALTFSIINKPAQDNPVYSVKLAAAQGANFNNASVELKFNDAQNTSQQYSILAENNYAFETVDGSIPAGATSVTVKLTDADQGLSGAGIFIDGQEVGADNRKLEDLRTGKVYDITNAGHFDVEFTIGSNGSDQGGDQPGPSGPRADAVIHLAGCGNGADVWTGVPMVDDYNGATTFDFSETWKGVPEGDRRRGGLNVNIIGTSDWTDSWYQGYGDQERQGYLNFTVDGVEPGQGDRYIVVATQWSETIDAIRVNNVDYSNQLITPASPMDQYFAHFGGQMIYSVIKVPAAALSTVDNRQVEVYEVEAAVRPITEEECKVGNFLWSNDPSNASGDAYVDHATMGIYEIEYNGQKWNNSQINECPYVGDYTVSSANAEGKLYGSMFVPAGAKVTMFIDPEPGYQVKSFNLSGSQFEAVGYLTGAFKFTVGKGNFHIGGKAIQVENKVSASATGVSDVKATVAAGGDYLYGNADLSISNASPSADKKADFVTAAGEEEVDIIGGDDAYLAIDLNQVVYKANSAEEADKENETWTLAIHSLGDGYSDVTMKFADDVDVSRVVLVHNIGDGEDFETIRPISYDEANHTATFRIKSFSTFAIAQAHTKTVPVTPSNTNTNTNGGAPAATTVDTVPKTAETFPIVPVMVVAIVSFAAMAVVVFERKRRA